MTRLLVGSSATRSQAGRHRARRDNRAHWRVERDVRRLSRAGVGMPAHMLDSLVVGADHPMIQEARAAWEREHGDGRLPPADVNDA